MLVDNFVIGHLPLINTDFASWLREAGWTHEKWEDRAYCQLRVISLQSYGQNLTSMEGALGRPRAPHMVQFRPSSDLIFSYATLGRFF